MNVVSIMAHQDDEMRCLGTMLKCRARGDALAFVTLTDGSGGFVHQPDISRNDAAKIRHEEMLAVACAVGAQFINLAERDEFLYDTAELRVRLIEAIRKTRADVIFTHWHEDYNLDHTITHQLVRQAALHSHLPMIRTDSPPLKQHPAIFCVEPHGPIPFPASYFVDVTDYENEKVRLLNLHRSQNAAFEAFSGEASPLEKICRRHDAYWGEQAGCEFAEAFAPMHTRGAIKPYPLLP
ncbi:PIG-L deacetylase family protein [Fontivita pretiosa]|uniref:PIG-L deacetylase family protein n=1 Tax=Fontivita pretiosa TaxID=2989684 RepID=UPI003D16F3F6